MTGHVWSTDVHYQTKGGNMTTYSNPNTFSNETPQCAWRLTGQSALGTLQKKKQKVLYPQQSTALTSNANEYNSKKKKDSKCHIQAPCKRAPQDTSRQGAMGWRLDLLGVLNCFLHYPRVIGLCHMLDTFLMKSLPGSCIFDLLVLPDQCYRRQQAQHGILISNWSINVKLTREEFYDHLAFIWT